MRFLSSVMLFLSIAAAASFMCLIFFDFFRLIFVLLFFLFSLFIFWSSFCFFLIFGTILIFFSFHLWRTFWLAWWTIRVTFLRRLNLRLFLFFWTFLSDFFRFFVLNVLVLHLGFFLIVLSRMFFRPRLMPLFIKLFFRRVFDLIGFFFKLLHSLEISLLKVFANLLNDVKEGSILVLVWVLFNVHVFYVLNKRILYFSRSIGINHHYKIPHQSFPIMEILRGLIINYPRIMKFAKPSKIHWDLIIESHQLRRLIKVLKIFMVVQHLDEALD